MTVAIITASMMLFTFNAITAEMPIMTITSILLTTSISFMVAVGQRCRWIRSREYAGGPRCGKGVRAGHRGCGKAYGQQAQEPSRYVIADDPQVEHLRFYFSCRPGIEHGKDRWL